MKVTLLDVLNDVAIKCGIISSYSETIVSDKKTELIGLVNEVKEEVAGECELASLLSNPFYIELEPEYTTGTAAITQNTIAVVGTDTVFTAAMVGRKIKIGSDSTVYEIATFTDTTHITLNRPFLGTTETVGAIQILQDIYDIPPEIWKFLSFTDDENDPNIWERDAKWIHRNQPDPFDHTGDAVVYAPMGSRQTTESVTVSAATTTTVTGTSLAGTYDDFYKGWQLYNSTRGKTVRISGFAVATGVITLEEAITGQTSSDTITLKYPTERIIVRHTPTTNQYLRGIGLLPPTKLVNDYDIEYEISEMFAGRVLRAGALYKYKKVYDAAIEISKLALLKAEYDTLKAAIKQSEEKIINRTYQFGRRRRKTLNPFQGSGWPAVQE